MCQRSTEQNYGLRKEASRSDSIHLKIEREREREKVCEKERERETKKNRETGETLRIKREETEDKSDQ